LNLNFEAKKLAISFVNFFFQNAGEKWADKVNSICLFGSVAQGRISENSDIDIFFDVSLTKTKIAEFRRALTKIKEEFAVSNEALIFKSRRIYNEISPVVGNLETWNEMKKSISSGGFVLYGKYSGQFGKEGMKQHFLFSWESPKKNRGAFINKLYGFNTGKKRYKGFVEEYGKKIGKSAALISSEKKDGMMKILEKYSVKYRIIQVFVDA